MAEAQGPKKSNEGIRTCKARATEPLAPEIEACICSITRRHAPALTRAELASVFAVSERTVARWETTHSLPAVRENARVLRYPIEAILLLCIIGVRLNRENVSGLGLDPDIILALAAKQSREAGASAPSSPAPSPNREILCATTDDDRLLLALWALSVRGPVMHALVRMISKG